MGFTIFIIVIRHTVLATIEQAFFARVSFFAVSRHIFTLLRDLELCDFLCICTALKVLYWGTAQLSCWVGGSLMKPSASAFLEPILNVDMLIVTFIF